MDRLHVVMQRSYNKRSTRYFVRFILILMRIIYYLSVLPLLYLGIWKKRRMNQTLKNGPGQVLEDTTKWTRESKNGLVEVRNGPVQRNLHNILLTKAMKAHEDLLESLSSLLSNISSLISFGRRNQELCLD